MGFPAGSHWTMNPIPTDEGPAPWPQPCSLHECKGSPGIWHTLTSFSIKDRIKVPTNLAPGDYTLSWRWDSELSSQVWTNCADITIVAPVSCPGGDLVACQALCPSTSPAGYEACVTVCQARCSSSTNMFNATL